MYTNFSNINPQKQEPEFNIHYFFKDFTDVHKTELNFPKGFVP